MELKAKARFVGLSPRKIRRVVDLIRGKKVNQALDILSALNQAASVPVEKTVRSAAANVVNLEGSEKIDVDDLVISRIFVDGGPMMKRYRPRAMGRAARIRKRSCHISVTLSSGK